MKRQDEEISCTFGPFKLIGKGKDSVKALKRPVMLMCTVFVLMSVSFFCFTANAVANRDKWLERFNWPSMFTTPMDQWGKKR